MRIIVAEGHSSRRERHKVRLSLRSHEHAQAHTRGRYLQERPGMTHLQSQDAVREKSLWSKVKHTLIVRTLSARPL